jgi:hydroxymethylglutaryl-CoA reductase
MVVVHLIYDAATPWANSGNTACEALAPLVEEFTGGRKLDPLNLADRRLATGKLCDSGKALETPSIPDPGGGAHCRGCALAAVDPYRAATHNKGIMNGIDAVVIATGNDWRAIEAGAHAYAARSGRYRSLSTWSLGSHAVACW